MSRQYWQECLSWATADGAAIASSASEALIFPNIVIPGNYMQDGRCLRLTARGRWGNVVTAVPTLTFRLRWGGLAGTLLAASPAIVTPATATTTAIWELMLLIQTRVNGAAGSLFAMGAVTMFEDAAATFGTVTNYGVRQPMSSGGASAPAAVGSLDLTADANLSLTAQWSASDAANTLTGHQYLLEGLN